MVSNFRTSEVKWTILLTAALSLLGSHLYFSNKIEKSLHEQQELLRSERLDRLEKELNNQRPVAIMNHRLLSFEGSTLRIELFGEKLREECSFNRLIAARRKINGIYFHDVNIERIDMPQDFSTKPAGLFNIGVWKVWPVGKGDILKISVNHTCEGRLVTTRLLLIDVV